MSLETWKSEVKTWEDNYCLWNMPPPATPAVPLELPSVTVICIDGLNAHRAAMILERCKKQCNFGAVKLLTNLETDYPNKIEICPLPSLPAYSIFCLAMLYQYVDTPHMLIVQHDGWIINADKWNPSWLTYDYMGPLFTQYPHVGSGGFSLRSRAVMEFVAKQMPPWDGTPESTVKVQSLLGAYEDGVIAFSLQQEIIAAGFKFAPVPEAAIFAQGGGRDPAYQVPRPFGFHGQWTEINHRTGVVAPFV